MTASVMRLNTEGMLLALVVGCSDGGDAHGTSVELFLDGGKGGRDYLGLFLSSSSIILTNSWYSKDKNPNTSKLVTNGVLLS